MFDSLAGINVGALLALGGAIGTVVVGVGAAVFGHHKAPPVPAATTAKPCSVHAAVVDVQDEVREMRGDVRGVAAEVREVRGSVQRLEVVTARLEARGRP